MADEQSGGGNFDGTFDSAMGFATEGAALASQAETENPLREAGEVTGNTADQVLSEINEAAKQAGVYLDQNSLQDMMQQLYQEGKDFGEASYHTLTDSGFWEDAANQSADYISDGYDYTSAIVAKAGEMLGNIWANRGEIAETTYDAAETVPEASADAAEHLYTTPIGTIATKFGDAVGSYGNTAWDGITSFGSGLSDGLDLQGTFTVNGLPQVPEALQQAINAETGQHPDRTQEHDGPKDEHKPDEPEGMGLGG